MTKKLTLFIFLLTAIPGLSYAKTEKALFAGGCFWCMEPPFDKLKGVKKTTVGYTGGKKKNPSYKQVAGGKTSHVEAILIEYDPKIVSYEKLLEVFWMQIDPTDNGGQFVDRGPQYRPLIFYFNEKEKKLAETSRKKLAESKRFKKKLKTEIMAATPFYPAEDYHQDFYKKSPVRYKSYRRHSGRDQFIEEHWGKKKK